MEKKFPSHVPPRPEVIRKRYAGFLSGLNRYMEHYRQELIDGMNERFQLEGGSGKNPPAKADG